MGTLLQLNPFAPLLLAVLMFLMKGALTLECHSCVDRGGDGGCNEGRIKKVTCPAPIEVCVETVAAVEWSHGNFSFGEKGCGMGMPGTNDKAVDVHGILAFSQLHQCNSSYCNNKLDIKTLELQSMDNESARIPNGVECYSCFGTQCSQNKSTVVKCYDSFRGCFDGNVTMRAGNYSLTLPVKACVKDEECTKVNKGSQAITLMGSCCSGNLCNMDLSNKTHFSAKIPQLTILTRKDPATTTMSTPISANTHANVPASLVTSKPTHSFTVSPSNSNRDDEHDGHDHKHDDDHSHNHNHGHHHDGDSEEFAPARDGSIITAVKVEERHSQQAQNPHSPAGDAGNLNGSIFLVLLLAALFI